MTESRRGRGAGGRWGGARRLLLLRAAFAAALLVPAAASTVELGNGAPADRAPLLAHGPAAAAPAADPRAAGALVSLASQRGRLAVIVQLEDGGDPSGAPDPGLRGRQEAFLRRVGATTSARPAPVPLETLPLVTLQADPVLLRRILADAAVVSVEEDALHRPALAQSTVRIDAPIVWGTFRGAGQVVAVLDTGADKTHPMLLNKVVAEACYSSNVNGQTTSLCPGGVTSSTATGSGVNCPTSLAGCFHGTHVAAIAVGRAAAGGPGPGVAPEANLVSIQVFSGSSTGAVAWTSDIVKGLDRVAVLVGQGVPIAAANLSLGGGGYSGNCDNLQPAMTSAIGNLRNLGVATVIASGNNGWTGRISSPACISAAIAVGSTVDTTDAISTFSNLSTMVDLMAPGQSITSAVPGGGYATYNGTSMATPHVAGACALLRQASPAATVTQVENALEATGRIVSRRNISVPRIDLDAAVARLAPAS